MVFEPDPEKVSVTVDMTLPANKKELQRFFCMVNYPGKFLPNLSDVSAPLRKLLEKDVEWCFDAPQMKAVQELKEMVTNNPVLKFYDIQLPTRVKLRQKVQVQLQNNNTLMAASR